MLAKVIRNRGPRKNARRDFARRVRYSCAKACEVALCNLAGLWPDAALQMEVAATAAQAGAPALLSCRAELGAGREPQRPRGRRGRASRDG